jgi:sec-independent protein translocase protein TatB
MLSIPHLIVLFIVALVVFGPEKLPELARNLGKAMSEFRRISNEMRYTLEDHLREIERESDVRKSQASAPSPQPAENTIAFRPTPVTDAPQLSTPIPAQENPQAVQGESPNSPGSPATVETEKNVGAGPA